MLNLILALSSVAGAASIAVKGPFAHQPIPLAGVPSRSAVDFARDLIGAPKQIALGKAMSASELAERWRVEIETLVARVVPVAVSLLHARGTELDDTKPVTYDVHSFKPAGSPGSGVWARPWAHAGGDLTRELTARTLGIETGPLQGKVSPNPRFSPRQLFRASAATVDIVIPIRAGGSVKLPITLELDDQYFPFVADRPTAQDAKYKIFGVSQRVTMDAAIHFAPETFGIGEVDVALVDQMAVLHHDVHWLLPYTFAVIKEQPLPDRAWYRFGEDAARDLNLNFPEIRLRSETIRIHKPLASYLGW